MVHEIIIILGLLIAQGSWSQFSLNGNKIWFSALFAVALYGLYSFDQKIGNIQWLKWLQATGVMSYPLYLLHVPFQSKVVNLGARLFEVDSFWGLIVQILGWMLSLTLSYAFFRIVEKPMNKWRKHRAKATQPA